MMRNLRPQLQKTKLDGEDVQRVLSLVRCTRFVPSLAVFDGIWRVAFHRFHSQGGAARQAGVYMQKTYFQQVGVKNIETRYGLTKVCWQGSAAIFAPHWHGVLGAIPGTGTGSQTAEAFHSQWQRVAAASAQTFTAFWQTMKSTYEKNWLPAFGWGEAPAVGTWPRDIDQSLISGGSLIRLGRNTASEYWRHRLLPNFEHREVGGTDYWVVPTLSANGVAGARRQVETATADRLVAMLYSEGAQLERHLVEAGVVEGEPYKKSWRICLEKLEWCFEKHAVVFAGRLPEQRWPRYYAHSQTQHPKILCTCSCFGQRGECEHAYFVQGLQDRLVLTCVAPKQKGRPPKKRPAALAFAQPKG